jgi:hypothetical protein
MAKRYNYLSNGCCQEEGLFPKKDLSQKKLFFYVFSPNTTSSVDLFPYQRSTGQSEETPLFSPFGGRRLPWEWLLYNFKPVPWP